MSQFNYEKEINEILLDVSPNTDIQLLCWGIKIASPYVWVKEDSNGVSVYISNADSSIFSLTVDRITKMFEQHDYSFCNENKVSDAFLDNQTELLFKYRNGFACDGDQTTILAELKTIASKYNLHFRAFLDIRSGRGWINYSQIDKNDYKVQVSTPSNYQEYNMLRTEISDVFVARNSILASEKDYDSRALGFQKELIFIDKSKHEAEQAQEAIKMKDLRGQVIQTQINGNVNTGGGSLNTGNANDIDNSVSCAPSDEKWFQKEVVKMLLSFVGGVCATIIAQWLMSLLGLLK